MPNETAGTSGEVVIRRATKSDLPRLGELGARLVREHHGFDPQRFFAATDGTPAGYGEFLGSQLDDEDTFILVAEVDGAVAGYAYAVLEGWDWLALRAPAGLLHDLIVDPAHRGLGLGRLLLDAAVAQLQSRGAPRIVLSTAERNEKAQRLFARLGFRRTMVEMTRELGDD